MKLLFDQNVSPSLVERLKDSFPGSSHVAMLSLDNAPDWQVWDYARDHGFGIVTKDADFSELSVVRRSPPKIIWLRIGNCTTGQIEHLLRQKCRDINEFFADPESVVLVLK